jgi:hypothetical protein
MDLGDLLILLLFLLPVLQRIFGKKQPAPPRKRRPVPTDEAGDWPPQDMDDPLGEALRQIREALGETEPEPVASSPPPRPRPDEFRSTPRQPTRTPEFREIGAFEHEDHGFGLSNPISEELFEQRAPFQEQAATDRIKQKPLANVDLSTPLEVKKVAASSKTSAANYLRSRARAREALIMKEVLDPPRSRRPRHSGRR